MKIHTFCAALGLTIGLSACACMTDVTDTNKGQVFANRVASSDKLEIESSQLALNTTNTPAVRHIAQQMITDHTKGSQRLMGLLHTQRMDQPPEQLAPYHARTIKTLMASDNFDCDYLDVQLTAHSQAISMFDAYTAYGDNAALRDFATQTLPTLQQHMEMIKGAEDSSGCLMPKKR